MRTRQILAVTAILLSTACTRIGPGYVGIKVSQAGDERGVNDIPVTTGWVFYNPAISNVYEYPTFVQTAVWTASASEGNAANEELTFSNADQQKVSVDISLAYTLDPAKVPAFYVKFRNDDLNVFTHGFLRNAARNSFDRIGGKYRNEQILGDNAAFLAEVEADIKKSVEPLGVRIEQFGLIGIPRLPEAVINAINEKIRAQQVAIQKQNEVAQAEADAKKSIATATGEAQAEIAKAEGYAKASLIRAEADAKTNRMMAESLTPLVVEAQKIGRWDGQLPQVTGSGTPFLSITPKQ